MFKRYRRAATSCNGLGLFGSQTLQNLLGVRPHRKILLVTYC